MYSAARNPIKKKKRSIYLCLARARRFVRNLRSLCRDLALRGALQRRFGQNAPVMSVRPSANARFGGIYCSLKTPPSHLCLTSLTALVRNVRKLGYAPRCPLQASPTL